MSRHLHFELDEAASEGRKTDVWNVRAAATFTLLGRIKWFGRWRQYAFFPEPDTVFNPECLEAISQRTAAMTRCHQESIRQRGGVVVAEAAEASADA